MAFRYTQGHLDMRCEVHVDEDKRIIHVLDTNEDGTTSVTNGIDIFQQQILADSCIFESPKEWTWVLYGTDGEAAVFERDNFPLFKRVEPNQLYQPFLDICRTYR